MFFNCEKSTMENFCITTINVLEKKLLALLISVIFTWFFSILLFIKIISFPLFLLIWFDFYLYWSIYLCFKGMRRFHNNLHFNLGDSLLFDSFIQQHLFHMKPNNSCTISKIRPGPQRHMKSKGKYMAALVGVWKEHDN